ncbi:MAG: hypothetical protein WKG01_05620 [Kofleriaceae bacterium]
MTRARIFRFILLGAALGAPACDIDRDDTAAPARIRTFEDWIATHQITLTAGQQAQYDTGVAVLGLVGPEDLPVRHLRSGVIEMAPTMLADRLAGKLDFRTDFDAWVAAGLYDPDNHEQREVAAARGDDGIGRTESAMQGSGSDTGSDTGSGSGSGSGSGDTGYNCRYVVTMNASPPVNSPATRTTQSATRACANYANHFASHYTGGAPAMGATADGGWHSSGSGLTFQCTQLANTSSTATSQVAAGFPEPTTEPADPTRPKNCPGWLPAIEVHARGKSQLVGDLDLSFRKTFLQWNPIGVVMPDLPWKGLASGAVEAYVNNSSFRASVTGELQVGSDCATTNSGSFTASVGPGGPTVMPSVGVSATCSTQAWSAADAPRNQPMIASVDDVPVVLTRGAQITAGVKSIHMKAEAWSSDPPEGRPLFSRWDMQSRASAQVRGGCIRLAFTGCNINNAPAGVSCRVDGAQASYSTFSGVDCAAFPVPVPVPAQAN